VGENVEKAKTHDEKITKQKIKQNEKPMIKSSVEKNLNPTPWLR